MFAFAIWDRTRQRLVLARDRLGIKPLYYTLTEDGVHLLRVGDQGVIEAGAVSPELNYSALADYAANRYTSGEETLFRGVRRLLPGHTLVWSEGRSRSSRYWDMSFAKSDDRAERVRIRRAIHETCSDESVRLRLMADVPLGMFLSGGIDSSAIAAVMSEMVSNPSRPSRSLLPNARRTSSNTRGSFRVRFGTEHHEIVVSPAEFFDALPSLVYQEDEPIAHPSSVPLYFVSRLAAKHVKVVLTGEGSDELLAGYGKYRRHALQPRARPRVYGGVCRASLRGASDELLKASTAHPACGRNSRGPFSAFRPTLKASTSRISRSSPARCRSACSRAETRERMGRLTRTGHRSFASRNQTPFVARSVARRQT